MTADGGCPLGPSDRVHSASSGYVHTYGAGGLKPGSSKQLTALTPLATKLKVRTSNHYWIDSATLHKDMKLLFPLDQVDNAVEYHEPRPRPWFETAGTIV